MNHSLDLCQSLKQDQVPVSIGLPQLPIAEFYANVVISNLKRGISQSPKNLPPKPDQIKQLVRFILDQENILSCSSNRESSHIWHKKKTLLGWTVFALAEETKYDFFVISTQRAGRLPEDSGKMRGAHKTCREAVRLDGTRWALITARSDDWNANIPNELEIAKKHGGKKSIVFLRGHFKARAKDYIVMELCSGGDLFSYLEKNSFEKTTFSTQEVYLIGKKLGETFEYFHSLNLYYGDLKLENVGIFVEKTADQKERIVDIRLLDYGGFSGIDSILSSNATHTLRYCPPEKRLSPHLRDLVPIHTNPGAVDMFGLGLLLILLYSGANARCFVNEWFTNDVRVKPSRSLCSVIDKQLAHLNEPIRSLLKELVDDDFQKRPTAQEFLERFEAAHQQMMEQVQL